MVEKVVTSGKEQLTEITPTPSQIAYTKFVGASNRTGNRNCDPMQDVANHAHQRAGAGLDPINSELVREIVRVAFNAANELRGYSDRHLKKMLRR